MRTGFKDMRLKHLTLLPVYVLQEYPPSFADLDVDVVILNTTESLAICQVRHVGTAVQDSLLLLKPREFFRASVKRACVRGAFKCKTPLIDLL
jgi:hypothetical protein